MMAADEDDFDNQSEGPGIDEPDEQSQASGARPVSSALTDEFARQARRGVTDVKPEVQCGACEEPASDKSKYCSKHRRAQERIRRAAFKGVPVKKTKGKVRKPKKKKSGRGRGGRKLQQSSSESSSSSPADTAESLNYKKIFGHKTKCSSYCSSSSSSSSS